MATTYRYHIYNKATRLIIERKNLEALKILEGFIHGNIYDDMIFYLSGICYFNLGNYRKAVELTRKATDLKPDAKYFDLLKKANRALDESK